MAYLMKLMMCLLGAVFLGEPLQAANLPAPAISPAVAAAQKPQCPEGYGDDSDIDEDDDAVERGDGTDEDVLIMEEDEDSNASGVGN